MPDTNWGVYAFYNGSTTQFKNIYMETLDDIQCIIDNGEVSPVIVMGDMNVQIPKGPSSSGKWYKRHHCVLLYDLIQENEMYCADFEYPQAVNYTFSDGKNKSHIDPLFNTSMLSRHGD